MNFSSDDKSLVQRAIQTEIARVRRSMNAAGNPAIAEILQSELVKLQALEGRVVQESVKEGK